MAPASTPTPTIQRTSLPLAELRAAIQQSLIQRDPDDDEIEGQPQLSPIPDDDQDQPGPAPVIGQHRQGKKPKSKKQQGPKPQNQPLVLQDRPQDQDNTEENFVGSSMSNSPLGNSTSTEIEGEDIQNQHDWANDLPDIATTGSCTDRRSRAGDKDLDNLAMAILPLIKRMLAVERDRRNPRPLM